MSDDREIPPGCFSPERLCAFSDGVLAIVITILVLDINVPEGTGDSRAGFRSFLSHTEHDLVVYAASFWLVGSYWVIHHTIFSFVRFVNRPLVLLNLLFLFATSLAPLGTKLKNAYPAAPGAVVTVGVIHFVVGLTLIAMWRYIVKHTEVRSVTLDVERAPILTRRIFIGSSVALGASLFAMVDARAATHLLMLAPIAYLLSSSRKLRAS